MFSVSSFQSSSIQPDHFMNSGPFRVMKQVVLKGGAYCDRRVSTRYAAPLPQSKLDLFVCHKQGACFVQPAVEKPKTFSLLSNKANKEKKIGMTAGIFACKLNIHCTV